jgi:hypothetical protein
MLDHRGINREALTADQTLGNAAGDRLLEQLASRSLSRKRPYRFLEKVE